MIKTFIKITIISLICYTQISCGYSVRGLSSGDSVNFYVKNLTNMTSTATYTPAIQRTVERYLVNYNELARKSYAKYTLDVVVNSIEYTPVITSQFDESIVTNTNIDITFIVTNRIDVEIYTGTFSAVRSYSVTGQVTAISYGREAAIIDAMDSILIDFHNNFLSVPR